MKRFIFMLGFGMCFSLSGQAQCTNTTPQPANSIPSDNSGDLQLISSCVYTGEYSTVSNINIGQDYVFNMVGQMGEAVEKYLTVTDISNNVIAHGATPLTVQDLAVTSVRLHYSENAACEAQEWCLNAYVAAVLTCPFPTAIAISNITTSSASFAWTPGNAETAWEVLVWDQGTAPPLPNTSGTVVNTTPQFTTNTLVAAQQYDFYVRANCGSEYSPWRGPYPFNSGCNPVALLDENFDGDLSFGELPTCWTGMLSGASPDATVGVNTSLAYSAPNSVSLANDNSNATANILLISPQLSTIGTATHRLKFYARGYGNVAVQVGTTNAMTADGVFTLKETINATSNHTEYIVDFTDYTGTDQFIAFRHPNTSTYNPIFLDNIRWEAAPLCPDLDGIIVQALTPNTATIGWEPGGSETAWDVVYSDTVTDPALLTPVSPAPAGTPEVTLSGLEPNTTYQVWVRSSCGTELGNGVWMNPVTFTTACTAVGVLNETFETANTGTLPECWSGILSGSSVIDSTISVVSNNAASGTQAVSLFNGDADNNSKIILVSPHLNTVTTGTHRLKFYARSNGPSTLEVGTIDSGAEGANFTSLVELDTDSNHTEYLVDYSTYSGTDNYIALRHTGGQYISIHVDDIRWEVAPDCADVTGIAISGITASAATVAWTSNDTETQWDVVYGSAAVTDPSTLTPISPAPATTPEAMLSGLDDNTDYKVWVRSVCGGTAGNGAWIGPIAFTTACLPTANFSEGFETTDYGSLPECWSAVLAGPTLGQYAAVRTVSNDAAFGTNAVELHVNSSEPTDFIMLVSPYVNSLSTGTHRLKFYARSYNDNSTLQVGTMNGNTSSATFTLFQTLVLDNVPYTEYTIDFTGYSGTDHYVVFRNTTGNYNSIFLDHIRWEVLPSCADVTGLNLSGITAATATVNWTAASGQTQWQVAHGPSTTSDPSTLTPSPVLTATSFNLDTLEDNTDYHVWVRSVCGGTNGDGAWIGPIQFRTLCGPTTVPFVQDFQSASIPQLPDCTILENTGSSNNWQTTWGDSGYGFEGTVLSYSGGASTGTAWYFTQGITLTGGSEYQISYQYGNNSSDNYVESLQVLYGSSATSSGMTQELADHNTINSGMAMTHAIAFTPATTGVYYFGFLAYSAPNQSQLYLDNIAVSASLSNPAHALGSLAYYPNPVQDLLYFSDTQKISEVTVYNLLGQTVASAVVGATQGSVSMARLAAGTYIVRMVTETGSRTVKVLKQ